MNIAKTTHFFQPPASAKKLKSWLLLSVAVKFIASSFGAVTYATVKCTAMTENFCFF